MWNPEDIQLDCSMWNFPTRRIKKKSSPARIIRSMFNRNNPPTMLTTLVFRLPYTLLAALHSTHASYSNSSGDAKATYFKFWRPQMTCQLMTSRGGWRSLAQKESTGRFQMHDRKDFTEKGEKHATRERVHPVRIYEAVIPLFLGWYECTSSNTPCLLFSLYFRQ